MKNEHFLLIFIFSLFLFFYPGDGYYSKLFAYNRSFFSREEKKLTHIIKPIPYLIDKSLQPFSSAEGVYVVDLVSFTPIFEKNSQARFLPASTAKIITALVAVDIYNPDAILTAQNILDEGQTMKLVAGEKMTFENLLYGLLVHSANDASYVLADNHPDGLPAFVAAMNQKARQLKMTNSLFKNPAGLDDPDQYATPYDLALAGRALMNNRELAKIVAIKNITVSDVDFQHFHKLDNVNKLLGEIPGIGGLKTGYTEEAGENLVTLYKKNGHTFLIVILKSADRFEDTKQIVAWIEGNVGYKEYE